MNYLKIALLMVLGLTATACGNDKTPNALSPSPSTTAPTAPPISPAEATSPPGTDPSTPAATVAPLPGAPLIPGTLPSSGVNPPGTYSGNAGNVQNGSNDNPPPRRKKAQVKKVTAPSPKVIEYKTPVKSKPGSKPVKEPDGDGVVEEEAEKPNKKLPTKPVKKSKDTSNDNSDEKEPAAKPAKPAKAEVDGAEGSKKPAVDQSKNQDGR
jgi:hypothetical protein